VTPLSLPMLVHAIHRDDIDNIVIVSSFSLCIFSIEMFKSKFIKFIVTFFYVGNVKFFPGTAGSVATLPLWILLTHTAEYIRPISPLLMVVSFIILLFFLSLPMVGAYIAENKVDDPREVVIDEVIGQLLTFTITMFFIEIGKSSFLEILIREHTGPAIAFKFLTPVVLFRVYDIWKPWIIGSIDSNMKNALGVILDDVVAGIFAGLTNIFLIIIFLKML
jgi:phosphatidylglycerophosphatase A